MRKSGFENDIVTNEDILSDFYSSSTVKPDPQAVASRHKHREHLKNSINRCSERILFHSATVGYGALRLQLCASSFAISALTTFPVGVSGMFGMRNIRDGRLYET